MLGGGDAVATQDGLPISDEIQTTQVDWTSTLLSSIFTAGLTDAPPVELEVPAFGVPDAVTP